MTPTYKFRIVGCLPGHEPIEFMRSNEPYSSHYWNAATKGIDPAWTVWTEFPMNDKDCISPRPIARTLPKPSSETRARLYAANPHQE